MAANVLVDTSFLVALFTRRDPNHLWASTSLNHWRPPWQTCDAVVSETFHLVRDITEPLLVSLIHDGAIITTGAKEQGLLEILSLMSKYADIPMSFADACLVRMTETLPDPVLLTTDSDFRVYRRHGRKAVPTVMPE